MVILHATYGRFSDVVCSTPPVNGLVVSAMCGVEDNARDVVVGNCEGRNSCTMDAEDVTYGGDQGCPSVYKYLEVEYKCE